ncbi:uncharacterized protein LOC143292269 [Babylonia areolata]|uniref:uncharacterized protein LOC143292269 n=1 Tax=Babylonia areolata TaxID=304850 RepID=UPI003FCF6F6D
MWLYCYSYVLNGAAYENTRSTLSALSVTLHQASRLAADRQLHPDRNTFPVQVDGQRKKGHGIQVSGLVAESCRWLGLTGQLMASVPPSDKFISDKIYPVTSVTVHDTVSRFMTQSVAVHDTERHGS